MSRLAGGVPQQIEFVFFDAGETLLRAHPSFPELFAEVCGRRGIVVDPGDIAEIQRRLAPHLIDLAHDSDVEYSSLDAGASRRFWTFLYETLLGELKIDAAGLAEDLYKTFSSVATYRLFDDALPTLRKISDSGYKLGLISNFEEWLEDVLIEQKVGHLFDVTVISGIEGLEKPDPAIYELALQRAGVDASRAIHVGDSLSLDVEPAQSVGMRVILLDRAGLYREADHLDRIETLEDLPPLLSKM